MKQTIIAYWGTDLPDLGLRSTPYAYGRTPRTVITNFKFDRHHVIAHMDMHIIYI
jgi:hypothetical protein